MCKRRKKMEEPKRELTPEEALDAFTLQKPEPTYDENGNRDYFTEYYQAYKNDYIDQYLDAYYYFKANGAIPDASPVEVKLDEEAKENKKSEAAPVQDDKKDAE